MFKKVKKITIRIIITVFFSLLFLKGSLYIPIKTLHSTIADKVVFVQTFAKAFEDHFIFIGETYKTVYYSSKKDQDYEKKYRELLALKKSNKALERENLLFREKLKFKKKYKRRLIAAEVISRSADNWGRYVVVNRGSKEGIKDGSVVINEDGLVGYVTNVFKYSSKIVLITDPVVKISCRNARTKEIGILQGNIYFPCKLTYIRYNSDIKEGDLLLSSGYSLNIPKNLPVGKVSSIKKKKRKIFLDVEVQPAVNISKLDIVFFIK